MLNNEDTKCGLEGSERCERAVSMKMRGVCELKKKKKQSCQRMKTSMSNREQ